MIYSILLFFLLKLQTLKQQLDPNKMEKLTLFFILGILLKLYMHLGDIGLSANNSNNDSIYVTIVEEHDFIEDIEDGVQANEQKQELVVRK